MKVKVLLAQACLILPPHDCSPSDSYVHGILQTRILEWVAIPSSKGSSWSRNGTQVSHIADRFFTIWGTRETSVLLVTLIYVQLSEHIFW